jgi:hypothetical protein
VSDPATEEAPVRQASVQPIEPLNSNYDPPQPWRCQRVFAPRLPSPCPGVVVGKVGACPVCADCGPIEVAAVNAERARIEALVASPEFIAEARREQAWEARVS